MTPEQAADSTITCFCIQHPQYNCEKSSRYFLEKLTRLTHKNNIKKGFECFAGRSDFWISATGELRPCRMFALPLYSYNLLVSSFRECWNQMVQDTQSQSFQCEECRVCSMRGLCSNNCAAIRYRENGRFDKKPEYLCIMSREIVRICHSVIETAHVVDPEISMIVPVYNAEKYLCRCIDSILHQSFQQFELILVDDGSTDQSSVICDAYRMSDQRIKVIHQENKGVSSARNAGILEASAPWISFCDCDDYLEQDFLRILYNKVQQKKDSLIIVNFWAGNELKNRAISFTIDFENLNRVQIEDIFDHTLFSYVWNKIYSRDMLREHRILFDESLNFKEDDLFNREYSKYCEDAVFIPDPLYVHLDHYGLTKKGLLERGIVLKDLNGNEIH